MSKSIVIPLTSLVTVSGTANLRQADTTTAALYLRRFTDAGVYIEEIVGASLGSGDWQFDCPDGNYQCWKSAYPDATGSNRIDKWHGGATKYRRITDEDEAQYIRADGTHDFTNHQSMAGFRLSNPGDPVSGVDAFDRDYGDARYLQLSSGIMIFAANVLIVDHSVSPDVAGKRYNTIQEAIDYASGTGAATGSSRWTVLIVPHKNNSSFSGYVENLTLKKYVDLVGLGMVLIKGSVTVSGTWTGGTFARLTNLVFNCEDVNALMRGVEASNCHYLVWEDLSAPTVACENSQFYNCGFWQRGINVTTLITSTGDNVFMGCFANDDVTAFIASDKSIGFQMLDDNTAYYKIT
jgi:hypothetical protein